MTGNGWLGSGAPPTSVCMVSPVLEPTKRKQEPCHVNCLDNSACRHILMKIGPKALASAGRADAGGRVRLVCVRDVPRARQRPTGAAPSRGLARGVSPESWRPTHLSTQA